MENIANSFYKGVLRGTLVLKGVKYLKERSSKRCLVPCEKTLVAAYLVLLLAKSFTLLLVKFLSPFICQIFKPSYLLNL